MSQDSQQVIIIFFCDIIYVIYVLRYIDLVSKGNRYDEKDANCINKNILTKEELDVIDVRSRSQ